MVLHHRAFRCARVRDEAVDKLRKRAVFLTGVALVAGGVVAPAQAQPLPTKSEWLADVRAAMHGSGSYLDQRLAEGGSRLAINLDIDNTALATYYDRGAAVRPVLRFTRHAEADGVSLLFNTGRLRGDGRLRRIARQLRAAGYHVTEVCGRRHGERLAHSKQRCRRRFVREDYRIIANVGNRRTDFVGGNYERAFRLPNYHNTLG